MEILDEGSSEANIADIQEQLVYQDPNISHSAYIRDKAEQLVADLNAKRQRDQELLDYFRATYQEHAEETFSRIQESIVELYTQSGSEINDKIQELTDVLERVAQHENDLAEFKQMLESLYQDVMQPASAAEL